MPYHGAHSGGSPSGTGRGGRTVLRAPLGCCAYCRLLGVLAGLLPVLAGLLPRLALALRPCGWFHCGVPSLLIGWPPAGRNAARPGSTASC